LDGIRGLAALFVVLHHCWLMVFAAPGLDVAIAELDIRLDLPVTDAKLAQQAEDYAAVVRPAWPRGAVSA
jgi:glycosyl hydrolase family 10